MRYNRARTEGWTPQGQVTADARPLLHHPPRTQSQGKGDFYPEIPPSAGMPHLFISKGDLCMRFTGDGMKRGQYGDRIFSFLNGMQHTTTTNSRRAAIRFAGIATHSQGKGTSPGPISIATAGTATTFNNSGANIIQGMNVKFVLPNVDEGARPSDYRNQTVQNKGMLALQLKGYWPHESRLTQERKLTRLVFAADEQKDAVAFSNAAADVLYPGVTTGDVSAFPDETDLTGDRAKFEEVCADLYNKLNADGELADILGNFLEMSWNRLYEANEEERANTIGRALNTSKRNTMLHLMMFS